MGGASNVEDDGEERICWRAGEGRRGNSGLDEPGTTEGAASPAPSYRMRRTVKSVLGRPCSRISTVQWRAILSASHPPLSLSDFCLSSKPTS